MALVQCTECGHKVANDAQKCPGCGTKNFGRQHTRAQWLFLAVVTVMIIYGISSSQSEKAGRDAAAAALEASKSAEQRAAEAKTKAQREADFAFAVSVAKSVKTKMKNPNSFEFVSAVLMDEGPLCLEYRGTNSFNAVVTQQTVVTRDYKVGNWKTLCNGRTGRDMKSIKYAM